MRYWGLQGCPVMFSASKVGQGHSVSVQVWLTRADQLGGGGLLSQLTTLFGVVWRQFDLITPKVIDLILCQLPSSSVHKFSLDSSDSNSMFLYFLSFPGVIFVRPCQFLKFHYFLMKLQLYIPLLSTSWEVASLPGIAPAKQALLESCLSPLFLNIQLATLSSVRVSLTSPGPTTIGWKLRIFWYFQHFYDFPPRWISGERSSRNFKYNLVAADRNEIFCFKNRNILIFLTTSWCSWPGSSFW